MEEAKEQKDGLRRGVKAIGDSCIEVIADFLN